MTVDRAPKRRILPSCPQIVGRPYNDVVRELQPFLQSLVQSQDGGAPVPHAGTHLADGSDPLEPPDTPQNVGTSSSAGYGPAYSYQDHVHALTVAVLATVLGNLLTTAGDLAIRGASVVERFPVGPHVYRLVSDPIVAEKVRWAPPWEYITGPASVGSGVASNLFEVALAAGEMAGGLVEVGVTVSAGGELQSQVITFAYGVVNKAGVYSGDGAQVVVLAADTRTSGLLAVTAAVTSGTNKVTVSVTATTTLGTPTIRVLWGLRSFDDQEVTPLA